MARFRALSRGTRLVLVAGPLLVLSLFFIWQDIVLDYGRAGTVVQPQDSWDRWGLVIGLSAIATVTLTVLRRMTEVEMSDDVPWELVTFVLGGATFALAIGKSLTDAGSTWTSYAFVGLAAVLALGSFLSWAETRGDRHELTGRTNDGISSAA